MRALTMEIEEIDNAKPYNILILVTSLSWLTYYLLTRVVTNHQSTVIEGLIVRACSPFMQTVQTEVDCSR